MDVERSGEHTLTPEEQAHLEKLRTLVESALADGKLSATEVQEIKALIHADNQVTPAELQTIRSTVRKMLGDAVLEYDWS